MDRKTPTTNHQKFIVKLLKDPETAAALLNEIIANYNQDEEIFHQIFLSSLKDITKAQAAFTRITKEIGLNGESLHQILSGNGNLDLSNLIKIIKALGLEMHIAVTRKAESI